jgi:hypothetical protein
MTQHQNEQQQSGFLANCEGIHREWHERANTLDADGLLTLYSEDAVLESPLVPAVLDDEPDGVLRGHRELRRFFAEGSLRRIFAEGSRGRPNGLVRWYRSGTWLTDGHRLLIWEYPRQTPDGDQLDLVEVMEIAGGLIRHHRIYWGWKGCTLLAPALSQRAPT